MQGWSANRGSFGVHQCDPLEQACKSRHALSLRQKNISRNQQQHLRDKTKVCGEATVIMRVRLTVRLRNHHDREMRRTESQEIPPSVALEHEAPLPASLLPPGGFGRLENRSVKAQNH